MNWGLTVLNFFNVFLYIFFMKFQINLRIKLNIYKHHCKWLFQVNHKKNSFKFICLQLLIQLDIFYLNFNQNWIVLYPMIGGEEGERQKKVNYWMKNKIKILVSLLFTMNVVVTSFIVCWIKFIENMYSGGLIIRSDLLTCRFVNWFSKLYYSV